jgi:tetratricopeptide (TPR) repeat protein
VGDAVNLETAGAAPSLAGDALLYLVADAYRAAALEGANMRRAADALEAIRTSAAPEEYFAVWRAIDQQIGLADETALQRSLSSLREGFVEAVIAHELARLERALAADASAGWVDWLRTYADALDHWRWPLMLRLADAPLLFPPGTASDVESIRGWTRLASHDRWPEANELLLYLARCDLLPSRLRASIGVYAAQVQLYHLFLPEQALPLLQHAEELAPDEPTVVLGRAEYALQTADYDEARTRAEDVTRAHPDFVEAFNLVGQACDREDDLETAEHWFLEALRIDAGDSSGYLNLLRLYGRPELFDTHESRLVGLLDRAIAVDPEGAYNAHVSMGLVYQQNSRYEEAHRWYDRAVELDPDRDDAYVQTGYAWLAQSSYADAERAFRKVVDVAPGAFDGHWGLAGLFETQQRWDEALECFRESLARRPEWRSSILGRTGPILSSLERYDEAESELLEALRLDPENDSTTSSLERLVATCYSVPERTETSLRILAEMLEIKGADYEPTYWNLVGNVKYFFGGFEEAIAAYSRAIELRPEEPVFHSNLSGAWESRLRPEARAEELEQAISAARRASELDPADAEYAPKLSALLAEQTVIRLSGERALELQWPPPLRVDVSIPLLPAVLDEQQSDVSVELLELIEEMRNRIKSSTGVAVPGIRFRELDSDDTAYVIAIRGTPLPLERLQSGKYFCPAPLDRLVERGIPAEVHRQALAGAWVDADHWDAAEAAGVGLWTPIEYMLGHLESVLRSQLDQFVDHPQVAMLLDEAGVDSEIAQSPALLTELVVALRALVRERVPILALKPISAEFLAVAQAGVDRVELVERLRALPDVAATLPGNDASVRLQPLDPAVEAELEAAVARDVKPAVLALSRRDDQDTVRALRARPRHGQRVAYVVASPELRPLVWALVESVPDVCVISRDELLERRAALADEIGAT